VQPFPANDRESRDLLRALVASAQGASLKSDQHYVIDEVWQQLDSRDREGYCEPSSNYCANIWYR